MQFRTDLNKLIFVTKKYGLFQYDMSKYETLSNK